MRVNTKVRLPVQTPPYPHTDSSMVGIDAKIAFVKYVAVK